MKKKNGFTLIELIAVLVILAILALIVTPLVMNIIRKAKISADRRSVDAYGRSVELAIATHLLDTGTFPTDLKNLNVEYTGKVVVCNVMQMKENGGIYLSECSVGTKAVKDSSTEDGWYHYGSRDITNEEYVDMYGKAVDSALKDYYDNHSSYPENISALEIDYTGKKVQATSQINPDGTVYLTNCSVAGVSVDTVYGIDKSTGVKLLLSKTNPITITNYENGNKGELYTFEHGSTEQTPELTDYRYIGNVPNNYVTFNNELWRIIGVFDVDDGNGNFEKRIKLVKEQLIIDNEYISFSGKQYEEANNKWPDSYIIQLLNGRYYSLLSETSQQMIDTTRFYIGYASEEYVTAEDFYNWERSDTGYYSTNGSYSGEMPYWDGKIALMYPSDVIYNYALGINDNCFNNATSCINNNKGWIANDMKSIENWLITPVYNTTIYVYKMKGSSGRIERYGVYYGDSGSYQPTLYLKSQVKITSGNGSKENPYQLSI